jgi:hypothetical protein
MALAPKRGSSSSLNVTRVGPLSARIVPEVRPEPPFDLGDAHPLADVIVNHLIPIDFPEGESAYLRQAIRHEDVEVHKNNQGTFRPRVDTGKVPGCSTPELTINVCFRHEGNLFEIN